MVRRVPSGGVRLMAVRGYCALCGRLVTIEARGWWPDKRNQKWFPVRHVRAGDDTGGKDCDGTGTPL